MPCTPDGSAYNHLLWMAQSNRLPARRVDEVLDLVGLQDVAKRRSGGFSLGMGQRLGIAAALLGDPQIMMFDEPVNGLDPEGILWIRTLMQSFADEGRMVFVSSHLMSEMESTADYLIVVGKGKLVADCPMAEFIVRGSATRCWCRRRRRRHSRGRSPGRAAPRPRVGAGWWSRGWPRPRSAASLSPPASRCTTCRRPRCRLSRRSWNSPRTAWSTTLPSASARGLEV